jgi:hypothetical protein
MQSLVCQWCNKTFTTKRRLDYHHLETKIPCHKKCRICGVHCVNAKQYKLHILTHKTTTAIVPANQEVLKIDTSSQQPIVHHNNEQVVTTQKMITPDDKPLSLQEIEEMRQKMDYYIPMEDFNWNYLKSIADKVEVTETYYNTVSKKNGDNGSEVEKIQGIERRTKLIFRAENAKQCLPTVILSDILDCLDPGKVDLTEMTFKLLHDVHAQRTEPRLLTIRGNDINRKNVSIYSRPPPTDDCYWIMNSNNVALQKTRDHCESLFNFALVSAIESLVPALTVNQGQSVILWLVCPYKREENGVIYQKAVTLKKDRDDNDALEWREWNNKDLIFSKTENDNHNRFLGLISATIEDQKNYILERLKNVELDDKRLNEFFELAKDASTGIV